MSETELGMDENVEGALAYSILFITGIVFYFLEEENHFIRFHSIQSMLIFIPLLVIAMIFGGFRILPWWAGGIFFGLLSGLTWLLIIILWLILMIKAYKGEKYELPIVGKIAREESKKS